MTPILQPLKRLARHVRRLLSPSYSAAERVIANIQKEHLTYLSRDALLDLYCVIKSLERRKINGILIEAGCALGGSAILMAAAKARPRPMYVYDVFGMIPAPSDKDGNDVQDRYSTIVQGNSEGIDGNKYYGYEDNLIEIVRNNFKRHGACIEENDVHLIKGFFADTLQLELPVALAHIDGDWYESVMTCLERIAPHLVKGGVMIVDDYHSWSGCRMAVDEYFIDKRNEYRFVSRSRLHIVRV